MYNAPAVIAVRVEAQKVVTALAAAYRADHKLMPPEWRPEPGDPVAALRRIGDFIAGMTDRYAIRQHEALLGPVDLPEGF
jgi:dGTPase